MNHQQRDYRKISLLLSHFNFYIFLSMMLGLAGCLSGSPQTDLPASTTVTTEPQVVINEILAHTDLPLFDSIELFNPSNTDLNIGGWYLSDKKNSPKRFQLPGNLVVPANGYLVLNELLFRNSEDGFGLSEKGESIYLSAADETGALTGFLTMAKFGASPNGVSFGRIGTHYALQTEITLGRPNALPIVGPIILSEIALSVSQPENSYIIFENIASHSVFLFDPETPDNRWRIRKSVQFDFPLNIEIAGKEQFIVAANPDLIQALTTLRVFGPFDKTVDITDGQIVLERPGVPNGNKAPYMAVDQLDFTSMIDSQSISFSRIDPTTYGNDPDNWQPVTVRYQ